MTFAPGDLVHVAAVGKGVVREVRNGGRFLVDVNGRAIVTTAGQLTRRDAGKEAVRAKGSAPKRRSGPPELPSGPGPSLDLHGNTVDESVELVSRFVSEALLAGHRDVRIIHGRSGGRLKSALHAMLKEMPSIRGFALDPANPGVTIVRL